MIATEKEKTECIEQIVEMLRAYYQEPNQETDLADNAVVIMANTIMSELVLYLPKADIIELQKQFNRQR
jgi:hypothetical protein